jgi:hypothetical protein
MLSVLLAAAVSASGISAADFVESCKLVDAPMTPREAAAAAKSSEAFYDAIGPQRTMQLVLCLSTVKAAAATIAAAENYTIGGPKICVPAWWTAEVAARRVVNYARSHPEDVAAADADPYALTILAFDWPSNCK